MTATISENELLRDAIAVPSDAGMATVGRLARDMLERQAEVEQAEQILTARKQALRRVAEELLPAAMREHGMTEIRMDDGSRVTVKQIVRASIPVAKRAQAFAWLEANGHGDLLKHDIRAQLGRGESEQAERALTELASLGIEATDNLTVHPQTLSAFVREQTEAGRTVPDELLGVYRGEVAQIKRAKS